MSHRRATSLLRFRTAGSLMRLVVGVIHCVPLIINARDRHTNLQAEANGTHGGVTRWREFEALTELFAAQLMQLQDYLERDFSRRGDRDNARKQLAAPVDRH